jgi:hypothetical protein
MKVGVLVPQGWTGEYDGRDPSDAWSRTVAVARQAESLGFESIWLFDQCRRLRNAGVTPVNKGRRRSLGQAGTEGAPRA